MSDHSNRTRIKAVARALDALNKKVVFVGGATISLYPERPVLEVRPTDDVDVIIEILNYTDRTVLEEKLRAIGFSHGIESGVICRYRIQGIIVDIMPTNDSSVGFSNKWYPEGFKQAVDFAIDETCSVKILSAPFFIATKLEAFKDRGKNDGRTSEDFEDIVYVLENREGVWDEMMQADAAIKKYLQSEFLVLLNNPDINEWIDSHAERGYRSEPALIIEEMKEFVK